LGCGGSGLIGSPNGSIGSVPWASAKAAASTSGRRQRRSRRRHASARAPAAAAGATAARAAAAGVAAAIPRSFHLEVRPMLLRVFAVKLAFIRFRIESNRNKSNLAKFEYGMSILSSLTYIAHRFVPITLSLSLSLSLSIFINNCCISVAHNILEEQTLGTKFWEHNLGTKPKFYKLICWGLLWELSYGSKFHCFRFAFGSMDSGLFRNTCCVLVRAFKLLCNHGARRRR
jgi:hypothetical protein